MEALKLMEILGYIVVIFIGILFSLKRSLIKNSTIFFLIWYMVYCSLSLVVRYKFDSDIITYANRMDGSSLAIYYIREPVVWLGHRFIFELTKDAFTVFVFFDVILGIILFKALRNFNVPQYAFFSVLVFFPFVLGMQNVYRQWVANIFFLYCFSFLWNQRKNVKAYTFFVFSVLSHNIALIFIPLLFIKHRKRFGSLVFLLSFVFSFIVIYIGSQIKSPASTGSDLSLLYLFLQLFFLFLVLLLDKGVFLRIRKLEYKLLLSLFIITFMATLLLSSAYIERVSMFCLIVTYPFLINLFEERIKPKVIIRIIFVILGFVPILFTSVSRFILE